MIGAKLGAQEVFQLMLDGVKNEKGIHIGALLTSLSALAGYSCQASLRAQAVARGLPEVTNFQVVGTNDGKHYFFGDALYHLLVSSEHSIWALACVAAQEAGASEFPDLDDIFQHTASVLGSKQFGIPRAPAEHQSGETPINFLKVIWPALFPTIKLFCPNPKEWPVLYGLAIQEAIYAGQDVIEPSLAVKIVMESAIPMSKVDLTNP